MCKCTPSIRTPYCGKGDCVWPEDKATNNLINSQQRVEVNRSFMCDLNNILTDARENASQLLEEHEQRLGRTTKGNRMVAEMYEKEIKEIDLALQKVKNIIGVRK